jgi:hypothetical protein
MLGAIFFISTFVVGVGEKMASQSSGCKNKSRHIFNEKWENKVLIMALIINTCV